MTAVTTVDDLKKQLEALAKRVTNVEDKVGAVRSQTVPAGYGELRHRVEDVLDYLYGTNVRPPLTTRGEDEQPAKVVPTSADYGTEEFERDVK